jgi:hypothetical protein
LLIGEVKWSGSVNIEEEFHALNQKIMNIPFNKPEKIYLVIFQQSPAAHPEIHVFTPDDVIGSNI